MMDGANERIAALEQHARVLTDALTLAVSHISALTVVNAAVMAAVADTDRAAIREAALSGLGDGPEHLQARHLVEILTQSPAAAVVECQTAASVALAAVPARLQ